MADLLGCLLLDTRTTSEYNAGHVRCSHRYELHLAPTGWQDDILDMVEGDKETYVVTYCAAGIRAGTALDLLQAEGYLNSWNGGGYDDERATLEDFCSLCEDLDAALTAGEDSSNIQAIHSELDNLLTNDLPTDYEYFPMYIVWIIVISLLALAAVLIGVKTYHRNNQVKQSSTRTKQSAGDLELSTLTVDQQPR